MNTNNLNQDKLDTGCYLPSEEEIAAACLEIQAGWSESDEFHRRVTKLGEWAKVSHDGYGVRSHCEIDVYRLDRSRPGRAFRGFERVG